MKQNKGQIALSVVVGTGIALTTMIGSVFAWTYNTFAGVNDKISIQNASIATVTQKTTDIDDRLTRIENKLDSVLSLQRPLANQK